ncbi:MAG: hypothetical protein ACOYOP_09500 [Microthrixaceae bacterium]
MNLLPGVPAWWWALPAVAIWIAALVDVARDHAASADSRLLWGVLLVVAAPLAPLRFVLRRKVQEPRPTAVDPARAGYITRVEALTHRPPGDDLSVAGGFVDGAPGEPAGG